MWNFSIVTFKEFSKANASRSKRWHHGEDWNGADWSNALCGEVGELANIVKKLRREETGCPGERDPDRETLLKWLRGEIGDVYAYLDLVAQFYGFETEDCIREKFNEVSRREGFPERIGNDSN